MGKLVAYLIRGGHGIFSQTGSIKATECGVISHEGKPIRYWWITLKGTFIRD